jgi:hypothetical protein
MSAFLDPTDSDDLHFPSRMLGAKSQGHKSRNSAARRRTALSDRAVKAMILKCGRRMIYARDFDVRLHWWYRLQHYARIAE